jgi:hypothetical protein
MPMGILSSNMGSWSLSPSSLLLYIIIVIVKIITERENKIVSILGKPV